jgi:antirestriction protein ArdC
MANDKVKEVMQEVTNNMVTMLQEGIANPAAWAKSWKGVTKGLAGATNATTGNRYRGGNAVNLAIMEMVGKGVGPWATYKQWESVGAQVRKGEKATWILVPKTTKKVDERGDEKTSLFFGVAPLFPSSAVDGWERPEPGTLVPADGWIAEVVHGAVVVVAHGDPACATNGSVVYMPDREMFDSETSWFSAFAHELTHWSGHAHRAGERVKGAMFGDPAYAAEELVAELGAAIAASLVGIEAAPRADHAHYLANWLRACEGEKGPERLWEAAKLASAAVEWLDSKREVLVPA